MSQSATLGDIWTAHETEWQGQVQFLTINAAGYESGLPEYNSGHDLPTLQDDAVSAAFESYNAHKWYLYLLDGDHVFRLLHYNLSIPSESERLVEEVNALVEELP